MSDIRISKDANALICLIYKYYLELRSNGVSKSKAKSLGSSKNINQNIIPEWSFDDVEEACRELHRNALLDISYYDNICSIVHLSDDGIVYMENRFSDKLKSLLDYIDKIKFW